MRQLASQIRATLEAAREERNPGRGAKARCSGPLAGVPLIELSAEDGKTERRLAGLDSSQFPDISHTKDLAITISVIEGPSKGLVYEMRTHCITLGRTGGGADFQFNEPKASEIQCIVAARQDGVCLYDAVSIHGTYVNDQRIAASELAHMSTFRIGSSVLLVKVHPNCSADIC